MEDDKHFIYFERGVLNHYRTNSHVYKLIEDDMGGELNLSDKWNESDSADHPYISFNFGFKKLESGVVCIAVFAPIFKDNVPKRITLNGLVLLSKNLRSMRTMIRLSDGKKDIFMAHHLWKMDQKFILKKN